MEEDKSRLKVIFEKRNKELLLENSYNGVMDMYRSGLSEQFYRQHYTPNNHHMDSLQQDKDYEHLKEVEHQREQLEKKYDELRLKHSELEQKEKDMRMKMALGAYEQLCLNIGNEGRSSIRHLLVNLCQAEFERNFEVQLMLQARSKKIAQADKEVRSELESLFEKEFQFAQTRAQGNIWMIGELYNYGILSDNMILYYISRLLDEHSDVSWLWLCELIVTAHTSLVKNEVAVDKYFMKIREIFKSKAQLSNNTEIILQNIILDWEAKADPGNITTLAEEKVPENEPVAFKPVVYTVQSFDKANVTGEHNRELHREFNKPRGGKSRGRYRAERGFGNGSQAYNRPPPYSSIIPMNSDGYSDWYDQNMCSAYGLPKYRPFNDGYAQHGTWQGRSEQDVREQKIKRKSRQQQNKSQDVNSATKKDLLDGEMKIGFRKQTQKKSPEDQKKSTVEQNNSAQHSTTGTNKQVPESTQVSTPSVKTEPAVLPQHKLWSALGVKVDDEEPTCTDKATTSENLQVPAKMTPEVPEPKIPSPQLLPVKSEQSDEDDDADVLILSEVITEVTTTAAEVSSHVESPKKNTELMPTSVIEVIPDDIKSEITVPCEYSSGTSEYSSPMESPVPCDSKDKSSEIWTRLALLPQPNISTTTSADNAEKAEG